MKHAVLMSTGATQSVHLSPKILIFFGYLHSFLELNSNYLLLFHANLFNLVLIISKRLRIIRQAKLYAYSVSNLNTAYIIQAFIGRA